MHGMYGKDVEAKLAVLEEIKALMDERLGGKIMPEEKDEVSIEKVSMGGLEDSEKDELEKMYSSMLS